MKPTPGVWGIDLGQCALKALRLQEIEGQLQATAFDYVEYPKILSQPDADPDQLIREALEQFISRNPLRGDVVAIAVPGQSGLARFVKLPPVEEKKIADIVKFEAKQQIPFNLEEVVWDYQKLGASNVVDGFALETEIGLFAMKRDMVNKYLNHFKDVGVEVHIIQMAPLSLCNFVAFDLLNKDIGAPPPTEKQPCVVALDLGTDSSNLVVTDGVKVIWQRPIPLGGNHFTRALTKDMKLTFAKAEHLKRNATKSGAAELKKVLASLKPVLNDFVGEVQRSLGYFTNTHRDAQIEYMVGLGNAFRLPGLQRFLAEKLQLDVRKMEKMNRITGDVVVSAPIFNENILSFGVAYGLCLQGLKQARLITNLLPGEIRMERLVRAKKPWAVAAASLLLVGLGGVALGNYLNERPYTAPNVTGAIDKATATAGRAGDAQRKFEAAKSDAQKEEEGVKSIIAGQAERINWLHLLRYISDAVPTPDGANLPPEHRKEYFENLPTGRRGAMRGRDAYNLYLARLKDGFKPPTVADEGKELDPLPPGIDDLVQFSIESVDCRYCDDLNAFWKAAIKGRDPADVRPQEHYRTKMPEGKGWVIELAGYTYHAEKAGFVRNTLLNNLARLGVTVEVKPAEGAPATGGATTGTPATGTGTPPATTGGTPAPATGTAAAGGTPKVDFESTKEPIKGKVSHVLLFNQTPTPVLESSGFEIIQTGVLDSLLGGGGAGGAGGPGGGDPRNAMAGMMQGMMQGSAGTAGGAGMSGGTGASGEGAASSQPSRSGWSPLSSRGGGTGAGGLGSGGPPGRGLPAGATPGRTGGGMTASMMTLPGGTGGPGSPGVPGTGRRPGEGATGTGTTGAAVPKAPGGHTRTEFIIVFIWNEPTPSDALRGDAGGSTPPATPAPGR